MAFGLALWRMHQSVYLIALTTASSAAALATNLETCKKQPGIPGDAIALAVAINSVLDFFMTSTGLACLQVQVTLVASNVGMLDEKRLHRSLEL